MPVCAKSRTSPKPRCAKRKEILYSQGQFTVYPPKLCGDRSRRPAHISGRHSSQIFSLIAPYKYETCSLLSAQPDSLKLTEDEICVDNETLLVVKNTYISSPVLSSPLWWSPSLNVATFKFIFKLIIKWRIIWDVIVASWERHRKSIK